MAPPKKTHCLRGHEFTKENTWLHVRRGREVQSCRACANWHSRRNRKRYYYGVTQEHWDAQFEKQGRCCAVCWASEHGAKGWQTDHDHKTGKFRAILCRACNLALGHVKDDINRLQQLIEYLKGCADGSHD